MAEGQSEYKPPLKDIEKKHESIVFTNKEGLIAYRSIPPSTTESEISSKSLVIFTGIEPPNKTYPTDRFGYRQYKAPPGNLPVFLSPTSKDELTPKIQHGEGKFRLTTGGVNDDGIVLTEIPWEVIKEGRINLYANATYVKSGEQGEATIQLIPEQTEGGYIFKRDQTKTPSPNIRHIFDEQGNLISFDAEFLIATSEASMAELPAALSKLPLAFYRPNAQTHQRDLVYNQDKAE